MPISEEISIAPGEGKRPSSILLDRYCKELAFQHIFSNGQFAYRVKQEVKLSPSKYYNQQLLNYTQLFPSHTEYTFFALSITPQLKLRSQINIAIKKFCDEYLIVGMFSGKFQKRLYLSYVKHETYNFISNINGASAYLLAYQLLSLAEECT